MSSRSRIQIVVVAAVLIIGSLAALSWKFYKSPPNSSHLSQIGLSLEPNSTNANSASANGATSTAAPLGAKETAGNSSNVAEPVAIVSASNTAENFRRRSTPPGILGGGDFRKLYTSDNLTNIDYAWRRLMPICNMSLKQARERDKVVARMSSALAAGQKPTPEDPSRLSTGAASNQQQIGAFDRFYELCNKSFGGIPMTSDELSRVGELPNIQRFRAIDKVANAEIIDLNNVQTKGALETVVTTPMYATLQGILFSKLDTGPLTATYSTEQIEILRGFAAQILVCRLGDDCGSDGYTTLFTCRLAGICGNNYEDAVWDHLRSRNVDARVFRQFIDQRYQSLSLLDFSILKNSK